MQPGEAEAWDVPEAWRAAAEEVREHLCALRGHALFLSPADALLLVQWLDGGVVVTDILRALERASEARRARRSKVPLSLAHARRHLGRPTRGVFESVVASPSEAAFAPVVRALRAEPHRTPALEELCAALQEIQGRDQDALREALAAARAYFEAAWAQLDQASRAALYAEARAELGDLVHLVDEKTVRSLIDEGARDRLRRRLPCLSAASLCALIDA